MSVTLRKIPKAPKAGASATTLKNYQSRVREVVRDNNAKLQEAKAKVSRAAKTVLATTSKKLKAKTTTAKKKAKKTTRRRRR